ncbi:MAG: hypothetical protein NC416_04585 [Eubacterium sp.]|nr:hypothetical protein [Eubacterium sp.]
MIFCLTNAGKEYMAKVNAGEIQMHLTRAVAGSGSSSYLDILTSVVDERQQIQLDAVRSEGEYTFIECVLTNLELDREYVLRQLGIYASDGVGEDKLIIVGQDAYGDRIPILSEKEVEYQYNIGMRVSNASEVTFDFSVNDFLRKKYFYQHCEEFEEYKEEVEEKFKALPRVRIGPEQLLDRKNTILFQTLKETNKITRIRERDNEGEVQEYDLAASFKMARIRENLQTEDTLEILFGKIQKYFYDMKVNCFAEADDPFTLMTEATYIPPKLRTPGSLYGLETLTQGLIILFFDRYITGTETPTVENTIYGIETDVPSTGKDDGNIYKGIFSNIVYLEKEQQAERLEGVIYCFA